MDITKLSGTLFLDWYVEDHVGTGADGIVYKVKRDNKLFALKLFFPEKIQKHGLEGQLERLRLQLDLKGSKHHPNLVEIYDGGYISDLNTIFLVMEYIEGNSLDKLVGKIPLESVPRLLKQIAAAAEYLESKGLVHRDIKPANIVVNKAFKTACLLDLGIVHKSPDAHAEEMRLSGDEFVATVRYSPPEFVWRTEESTDMRAWRAITFYQIGATLFEMIENKVIFCEDSTPRSKLYDSVRYNAPNFENSKAETWLITLAKSCLVKSWRERLDLVNWDSFKGPPEADDIEKLKDEFHLKVVRADESKELKIHLNNTPPEDITQLWTVQEEAFQELRHLLLSDRKMVPFTNQQISKTPNHYQLVFCFELETITSKGDYLELVIDLKKDQSSQHTVDIEIHTKRKTLVNSTGHWKEPLSTERVCHICSRAIYLNLNEITSI